MVLRILGRSRILGGVHYCAGIPGFRAALGGVWMVHFVSRERDNGTVRLLKNVLYILRPGACLVYNHGGRAKT
jgi:hypothetical protein